MWELLGWRPCDADPNTPHAQFAHVGTISSIYLLQFIRPGDKLDTKRWAIMRPSWETTRLRNRMKEHRSSTIRSLQTLIEHTRQMLSNIPPLLPLFKHAWGAALYGVSNLVGTYAADVPIVVSLQSIVSDIESILLLSEDGLVTYPSSHVPFLSAVFPPDPTSPVPDL